MPTARAIADLLNAAWAEARSLPRVVARPVEIPPLKVSEVEAELPSLELFHEERNGELLSLVAVRPGESGQGLLRWFVTHPAHRQQGLASACLRRAEDQLRSAGCTLVKTASFVDSRVTSAWTFLERHGFVFREPQQQSIVMQIDMSQYEPRPAVLPEGYAFRTLRLEALEDWLHAKNGVFESTSDVAWFMATFGNRAGFDPAGWRLLYCHDEVAGIAAADFHHDPDNLDTISGCQIEYVGVLDEHRGKKLGEALMVECLNYTKLHRVTPCQLITQPFRTAAVNLYEKLGFRKVRENRIYEKPL